MRSTDPPTPRAGVLEVLARREDVLERLVVEGLGELAPLPVLGLQRLDDEAAAALRQLDQLALELESSPVRRSSCSARCWEISSSRTRNWNTTSAIAKRQSATTPD